MKVESIKKHEVSRQHRDCESATRARARPDKAPLEKAFMNMQGQQEQMEKLFRSAYYLVQAEHPFRDFPKLMQLQEVNGLSFGQTSTTVQALQKEDFFSVCMDSSTDTTVIEEEMVQVRYLENNLPVYRSVHVVISVIQ